MTIASALLSAGFDVTILTRSISSIKNTPSNAKVVEVDYTSFTNLTTVLKGHDAVVSTVGMPAVLLQTTLIDAAIAAGVQHFIPSDYGLLNTHPEGRHLPVYASMVTVQDYLQAKAADGKIAYSIMACGGFLSYLVDKPFLVDWEKHACNLYDEGTVAVSGSSYETIAKAVVAVIKQPEEWKNRVVRFHDTDRVVQKNMLEIAKRETPGVEWTVVQVSTDDLMKQGMEETQKGDMMAGMKVLGAATFGGKYEVAFKNVENEKLGIEMMSEKEFEEMVAKRARLAAV